MIRHLWLCVENQRKSKAVWQDATDWCSSIFRENQLAADPRRGFVFLFTQTEQPRQWTLASFGFVLHYTDGVTSPSIISEFWCFSKHRQLTTSPSIIGKKAVLYKVNLYILKSWRIFGRSLKWNSYIICVSLVTKSLEFLPLTKVSARFSSEVTSGWSVPDDAFPLQAVQEKKIRLLSSSFYPLWYLITIAHAWTWPICFSLRHSFMRCIFIWKLDRFSCDDPHKVFDIDLIWCD